MNVYNHIDANNRKIVAMIFAFPVTLFIIVFLFFYLIFLTKLVQYAYLGVSSLFAFKDPEGYLEQVPTILQNTHFGSSGNESSSGFWGSSTQSQALHVTLTVFPWMALVALLWIWFSYYKADAMILKIAGAHPVTFRENSELYRLVENTGVMAGLPVPQLYIINDDAMNAFATGNEPEKASITLTKGIIEKLNKSELQAVIAHEFAHIGNRDTRLMQLTIMGIGLFIFFAEVLLGISVHGGKSRFGRITLISVAGIVFYIFGCIAAPILRFALSRLQEYQADATAVKIIRDPNALARALSKIAVDPKVDTLNAKPLIGSICIVSPTKLGYVSRLYESHPPIKDRIAVLKDMAGNRE